MTGRPTTVADVQEALRGAGAVIVRGGSTKSEPAGRPIAGTLLDLRGLTGIVHYSPKECVLTARGGTPLAEIATLLDQHRQYLPFDPPFMDDGATIGGTVAAGINGPGRYRYGGVRDFLIGVLVADGEGRVIRSGGRVVKNAAGFLLHHAVVGSRGSLGVVLEVTLKVFPRPEAQCTVTARYASAQAAYDAARTVDALGRDYAAIDFDDRGTLSVRIAGRRAALEERARDLRRTLGKASAIEQTEPAATETKADRAMSWVKVAAAMDAWPGLQPHVRAARFMCAGRLAWLGTADVTALDRALDAAGLAGVVFRGPRAGRRVGRVAPNAFETRVRRVLDPRGRFRAASDSRG